MIVECVPNISEGRNIKIVDEIVASVRAVGGVRILHVDSGFDANRTVVSFAGDSEAVLEGAFRLIRSAAALIDMRSHEGAHPRIGATDVCPFVPLEGASIEVCIDLACRLGRRVANELHIPVYLYEAAAERAERRSLSNIRRGGYEMLASKLRDPDWLPDFGAALNERSGATVIGARNFLIAYNVNLDTPDPVVAAEIAARIRETGRKRATPEGMCSSSGGLLKCCKALGWYMKSYGCAQVSINLTNFHVTGLCDAFAACAREAETLGCRVCGSEIIGLVPQEFDTDCQFGQCRFTVDRTAITQFNLVLWP